MAARFLALISIFVAAVWAQVAQPSQSPHTVDPELLRVVEQFAKAVDNGDVAAVAAAYSPEFRNVRVADDGGFAQLSRRASSQRSRAFPWHFGQCRLRHELKEMA